MGLEFWGGYYVGTMYGDGVTRGDLRVHKKSKGTKQCPRWSEESAILNEWRPFASLDDYTMTSVKWANMVVAEYIAL